MHKQIEKYILQGKQLNLSGKTLDNRRNVLFPLLNFLKNRPLTLEATQEYISFLQEKHANPATLDCYVKTIRAFINFLGLDWSKKLLRPKIHRKPLEIIPSELAEQVIIAGTEFGSGENGRCKKAKEKARLCLRFILRTGLRVQEALSLTYEAINFEEETFRVISKGGDVDIMPLPHDLIEELKNYPPGRLFCATPKTLNKTIQRGAKKLKIKTYLHTHSLRHIFATTLLKQGISPAIVQRLMRHKSFEITNRTYSHYLVKDLANALNSQVIVKKGLTVDEIFNSLEKSAKSFVDERFKLEIQREEKSIVVGVRLV